MRPTTDHAARESAEVAVVDDDPVIRRVVTAWLERAGFAVRAFARGDDALRAIGPEVSVACVDLGLDDMDGLELIERLRAKAFDVVPVVMTADDRPDVIVRAMRAGAIDYVVKPLEEARVLAAVWQAAAERTARVDRTGRTPARTVDGLVGDGPAMLEIRELLGQISDSDVSVCLLGETGTGKEVVARAIHATSRRRAGPLIAVNCAAVPESLEESELFGHEKGAFTGAVALRRGRFEQASGGTLFLDEVGDMSPSMQTALLRTLQERTIRRVGGAAEIAVNVRVVSATHKNLEAEVAAGRFREDLYYRLVVFPVRLPPLRERKEDLLPLSLHFLASLKGEARRPITGLSAETLAAMGAYHWPGNIRQLENVMHRAVLAARGETIEVSNLPPDIRASVPFEPRASASSPPNSQPSSTPRSAETLASAAPRQVAEQLREVERAAIVEALAAAQGNVARAAVALGMSRATLYRRLAALGIDPR
jgi:DNA-binding NtrC family response regulator